MMIGQDENLEVINTSLKQFGSEFVSALLSDEVLVDTLSNLCDSIKQFSKEEKINIAQTISRFSEQNSPFNK